MIKRRTATIPPTATLPALDVRKNLVILTGAGISAESGLRTFRDGDGLWEGHRVTDVATPEGFQRDPALVQSFYNQRRRQLDEVEPNAAHLALAELEKKWQGAFLLVTQNVDNLHERAGTTHLRHMHGQLQQAMCQRSRDVMPWQDDITVDTPCPRCKKIGCLRPNIVWFGEVPLFMEEIQNALERCDYFISIGTSGIVYPAAGFVMEAKIHGALTIECNLEPSGNPAFDVGLYGPATEKTAALAEQAQ